MKKCMVGIIAVVLFTGVAIHASAEDVLTVTHAFFEPFVWAEDGVSRGIYVDVLKEAIETRLGIAVQFQDLPWKRAQFMVRNGEIDGFVTLPTPERLEYAEVGNVPVAVSTMGLFTYADHPRLEEMKTIRELSDLHGYQLLTYLGGGWAEKNLAEFNLDIGGKSLKEVLLKLAAKRGDILVQPIEVTLFNIKKLGHEGAVVQVPGVVLDSLEFKLLIGKKSPYVTLLPEIDKMLTEMQQDGTLEAIYQKYR